MLAEAEKGGGQNGSGGADIVRVMRVAAGAYDVTL